MHSILVVDDDELVRRTIRHVLQRAGFETIGAAGGAEALRIAREEALSVALVDYRMPGMDGLSLLARLRDVQPSMVRLLVSGALDVDVMVDAVNRGEVARIIQKPVHPKDLVATVREAIETAERAGLRWQRARDTAHQEQGRALDALIARGGISLGLQPITRADDRRTVAFEALLRCDCPTLTGPEQVLAAAEAHDAVHALGRAVAHAAAEWLSKVPAPIQLFLNLHPDELTDAEALMIRMGPLRAHARRVVLEITERSSLIGRPGWAASVGRLREAGFRIAVDDLGAGASSLAALADIDPDIVKLDMSLTRDLDREPRKQRLVDLLCRFASTTGAQVVAEGIETQEEAQTATGLGVDLLQGWYLGRAETDSGRVLRYAMAEELPFSARRAASGMRTKALRLVPADDEAETG